MNINHFYHIWADANWQEPLTDHLIALHDNGLYDQLNVFNIGIVGSLFNINQVKQYLQEHGGDKVSIVVEVENGVEQDTIDFMIDSDAAGYALYSSTNDIFQDNEYEHNFRKELNKVLIKDWEKCRILLNDYSIVGAYYLVPELKVSEVRLKNMVADELKNDDVKITRFTSHVELYDAGYFSSNFFWTHLKYLKALGKPERGTTSSDHYIKNVNNPDKVSAEIWLKGLKAAVESTGDAYKVYDSHHSIDFDKLSVSRPEFNSQSLDRIYQVYDIK